MSEPTATQTVTCAGSVWLVGQYPLTAQRRGRYSPESRLIPARIWPAVAAYAIARYTRPGDLVYDPDCADATTLVEAVHQGRDAVGIQRNRRYARLARANVTNAHNQGATGRGRLLTNRPEDVLHVLALSIGGTVSMALVNAGLHRTRPPRRTTRMGPATAAAVTSDALLDRYTRILRDCATMLRPGGVAVVVARPRRRRGVLIDVAGIAHRAALLVGLAPVEECVAAHAGLAAGQLHARASAAATTDAATRRALTGVAVHTTTHDRILVLRKPGHQP